VLEKKMRFWALGGMFLNFGLVRVCLCRNELSGGVVTQCDGRVGASCHLRWPSRCPDASCSAASLHSVGRSTLRRGYGRRPTV